MKEGLLGKDMVRTGPTGPVGNRPHRRGKDRAVMTMPGYVFCVLDTAASSEPGGGEVPRALRTVQLPTHQV